MYSLQSFVLVTLICHQIQLKSAIKIKFKAAKVPSSIKSVKFPSYSVPHVHHNSLSLPTYSGGSSSKSYSYPYSNSDPNSYLNSRAYSHAIISHNLQKKSHSRNSHHQSQSADLESTTSAAAAAAAGSSSDQEGSDLSTGDWILIGLGCASLLARNTDVALLCFLVFFGLLVLSGLYAALKGRRTLKRKNKFIRQQQQWQRQPGHNHSSTATPGYVLVTMIPADEPEIGQDYSVNNAMLKTRVS